MGAGLIEPVDNLTDDTIPSNPELMEYLVSVMVDSGYDMKRYLSVVFNTRTYQSEVSAESPQPDEMYQFPRSDSSSNDGGAIVGLNSNSGGCRHRRAHRDRTSAPQSSKWGKNRCKIG